MPALVAEPIAPTPIARPVHRRARLVLSPTYKSPATRELVPRFVASFAPDSFILNVGAGTTRYGGNVFGIDIGPMEGVDVVAVAERLPVRDGSCDGVILQAVLEHVADASRTLDEIRRVLRPGGRVFVEVPFIQGYHPSPLDQRRYTREGLRCELLDHGFDVLESGTVPGPASAATWIATEYFALLLSGRSRRLYRAARPLTRLLATPVKFADRWLDTHPAAETIASGMWADARKAA